MKLYISKISELYDLSGYELLSERRKERVNRYHFQDDKVRCLISGLMLRYILGDNVNKIEINSYGKPYLDSSLQNICFNLSHGGDYVVLATDSDNIGIDVEPITPIPEGVDKHVFTLDELEWLNNQKKDAELAFFRLWTGKESMLKAYGMGFLLSPLSFSIMPILNGLHRINNEDWYINWYDELDKHALCISSKKDERVNPIILHREDLIS